ncbi:transposase, IS30 family [Sinorhizobium sp. NFACC03]|nr:transposase, IS30 family [Sinorhizobium sp. NFACC03]
MIEQLKALWSPEQIAGRLLADGVSAVRVCTETIYRFIYGKEDQALELYQHLPEGRRKRRPRGSRKPRDGAFPATNRISQRPDFIGNRSQFGHWEGDLLIFERDLGNANVTSLVERKSRYAVMIKNPSRRSRPIMDKIIETFSPLPAFARQSFTFDRGTEFAGFRALEDGIGARSWFCDPSAPWQKGAVENTNKRIRRFMPGDTDLSAVSQQQLVALVHHLNALPRKCLGYRTPAEVTRSICISR